MLNIDKAQIITYWQDLPWNEIKLNTNKYLPKFVFVLLIVLITQTFAKLTWEFFYQNKRHYLITIESRF